MHSYVTADFARAVFGKWPKGVMPPLSGSIRVLLLMCPIPEVAFVESALIVEGDRAPVAALSHI